MKPQPDKKAIHKPAKSSQNAKPKAIAKPKPVKPVKPKVQPVSKDQPVQDTLKAAQAKIAKLEAENAELKARLDELTKKPLRIAGWLVVQRRAGGGNCKYWYAGKSIGGKMKWIYLGKMLKVKEARVKIEAKAKKFLTRKSKRG